MSKKVKFERTRLLKSTRKNDHSDEDFKEKCKQKRREYYNKHKDDEEFREKCRKSNNDSNARNKEKVKARARAISKSGSESQSRN